MSTKVCLIKAIIFPVVMYRCESWTIKKAQCWRMMLSNPWCWRRLKSPLDCKDIQPVHPKGNQPWIFTGRTDAEAPILWSPEAKSQLIGKDPDAGKDWRWVENGMIEDEMVGQHHQLLEFAQTHACWVSDAIQPSPLSCPSPPAFFCDSALHSRWPKYWSFSFSISPSNEYSGLISFRIDWLDLLAV